jgi:phosphopantetheinyl transferase (holo-ACP synthase)
MIPLLVITIALLGWSIRAQAETTDEKIFWRLATGIPDIAASAVTKQSQSRALSAPAAIYNFIDGNKREVELKRKLAKVRDQSERATIIRDIETAQIDQTCAPLGLVPIVGTGCDVVYLVRAQERIEINDRKLAKQKLSPADRIDLRKEIETDQRTILCSSLSIAGTFVHSAGFGKVTGISCGVVNLLFDVQDIQADAVPAKTNVIHTRATRNARAD